MKDKKGKLIIVRHTESEWNKQERWTGQYDADLTPKGIEMAERMAKVIEDINIDRAFTSKLVRAQKTLNILLKNLDLERVPIETSPNINERDYGDYTGKNKWEMKEIIGEERFNCVRRAWDCPVPNGETLRVVHERVIPYYKETVLPNILKGENVILVAHTNSIRALIKYIEGISDEDIRKAEMPFGTFFIYSVNEEGKFLEKEVRELGQLS